MARNEQYAVNIHSRAGLLSLGDSLADRDKNQGIDQRNKRDEIDSAAGLVTNGSNMEAAEELIAKGPERWDNCRMEVSADLGVWRDPDRDRRCNAERCDDKQQ